MPAARKLSATRTCQPILKIWLDHGATLGNHTWSHPDLNQTALQDYEADLLVVNRRLPRLWAIVRSTSAHPFLHAGKDAATRRGLEEFLAAHDYRIAPVTLDNSDWMFAAVYAPALSADPPLAVRVKQAYLAYMESIFAFFEARSMEVVGREFPQTLLIHASQLNADAMPELLAMIRRRGYRFVSLETALQDEAYRLPDEYYGTGGFSWIHRWSKTKGMPGKGEPDEKPPGSRDTVQEKITASFVDIMESLSFPNDFFTPRRVQPETDNALYALAGIYRFSSAGCRTGSTGGSLSGPGIRAEAHIPRSRAPPSGVAALPSAGGRRTPGDVCWYIYAVFSALQRRSTAGPVPPPAGPTLASGRARRPLPDHANDLGPGGEHGNQFLNDHHLAGVWRRNHSPLPDPTAWPGLAELPGRRCRPRHWGSPSSEASPGSVRLHWETSGWTWSALCFGSFCRWLWSAASSWSGRACRSTWRTTRKSTLWRAEFRPSPKDRWPRWSSSRIWGPTAAASSTPTAPILMRIPTPLVNFLGSAGHRCAARIAHHHVRPHDRQASRRLGIAGRDGGVVRWRPGGV